MHCREFFRRTIRCVSKKITSLVFPAGLRCRYVGSESGFQRSPSPREGFRVGYDRYPRRAAVELPPDGTGVQPEILSNGRVCNVPKYPVFPAGLRCRCVGSESGFPRSPSPREGFRVGYDRYSRRAAVELLPDGTGVQPEILSNGRVCNVPKYPVFPVRFHAGASVASRVSREVPPRGRDLGWGMIGNHGVPPWSYRRTDGRAAGNPIERTGLQYVVARSLR